MTSRVVFGPEARAEMLEALDWYESHVPGLGRHFIGAIETAISLIQDTPLLYPVVHGSIRRARLKRFHYGLFYRVDERQILVIACFHSNRDPRRWQERS